MTRTGISQRQAAELAEINGWVWWKQGRIRPNAARVLAMHSPDVLVVRPAGKHRQDELAPITELKAWESRNEKIRAMKRGHR